MDLYFKTLLVFFHFVLSAYCLVSVVRTDWKILGSYSTPIAPELHREIVDTKAVMPHALAALWLTGLLIVAYGVYTDPGYLDNQKLWFKLFVVAVLTLNGLLIHRFAPAVRPGVVLAELDGKTAFQLNLIGVISSLSWVWACFVGTARAWNGTLSFSTILGFYLASLAAGISAALLLHCRWKKKATRAHA
ncbi:MAG: hypothetical protein ACK4KV_22085 [Rhodocyclaceae bacterium]